MLIRHLVRRGPLPSLRLLLFPAVLTVAAQPAFAQPAMEMDGDAVDSAPGLPEDWDVVLGWSGGVSVPPSGSDRFHARVQDGAAASVFTGVLSRDDQTISSWQWTDAAVPGKDDLLDGFAATYTGGKFYFGADRYSNSGDWFLGVWLLQDEVSQAVGGGFSGAHVDGDVFLLAELANGVPVTLAAYRWVSDGTGSNGTLDDVTAAFSIPSELSTTTNGSATCSPWPYTPQGIVACPGGCSPCFPLYSFVEGYVDLAVLGEPCFQSMVVETRSSQSLTAALKDFVIVPISTSSRAGLEIDGDAEDTVSGLPDDWNTVLGWDHGSPVAPTGSDQSHRLQPDPVAGTIFTGSNTGDLKDIAGWAWTDGPLPGKDDLLNAFVAGYPNGTLHFGADRAANNGDWNLGVWLLQSPVDTSGNGTFTSGHQAGDLFLQITGFLGIPPTATVFRWVGDGSGSLGDLDDVTSEFVSGCGLELAQNDSVVCSPWPYAPISPVACPQGCTTCYPLYSFLEGMVDLRSLAPICFKTVLIETRSSQSITALLKDFVILRFETPLACGSTTGVDPVAVAPRPQLLPPHPNPFRAGTEIAFRLETAGEVDLSVVRVDGSLVSRLAGGMMPAGIWTRTWDGRDAAGRRVGAGVYFVQLRIGDGTTSRRVVKLD